MAAAYDSIIRNECVNKYAMICHDKLKRMRSSEGGCGGGKLPKKSLLWWVDFCRMVSHNCIVNVIIVVGLSRGTEG